MISPDSPYTAARENVSQACDGSGRAQDQTRPDQDPVDVTVTGRVEHSHKCSRSDYLKISQARMSHCMSE